VIVVEIEWRGWREVFFFGVKYLMVGPACTILRDASSN
jgi:hypothetical protein